MDAIGWRDPATGDPLDLVERASMPDAGPLCGVLRRRNTPFAYPVADAVARLAPAAAHEHRSWVEAEGLHIPPVDGALSEASSVESFAFQWALAGTMRTAVDLEWRVASRFGMEQSAFKDRLVLDAGAGAGDQSMWLLDAGASVASVDLSNAIDLTAQKLRANPRWRGAQADVLQLPFDDSSFDVVYCEGVIQHTADSGRAVRELCRVVRPGGLVLATHYERPSSLRGALRLRLRQRMRRMLSTHDKYRVLLETGALSALSQIPGLGFLLRTSGLVAYSKLMPEFEKTWINTYDMYGLHEFQRHITQAEFIGLFESIPGIRITRRDGMAITAARE